MLALLMFCVNLAKAQLFNGTDMIEYVGSQEFDYIVIGCGVTGLVISARLSEDEDVSVLCLEAGEL